MLKITDRTVREALGSWTLTARLALLLVAAGSGTILIAFALVWYLMR